MCNWGSWSACSATCGATGQQSRTYMYVHICMDVCCLASPANFIYGRVEAKLLSHVTFMPALFRPANNFLGQIIGNASEGKYNTTNNSPSGEVTFQKCLNSGITLFSFKYSN